VRRCAADAEPQQVFDRQFSEPVKVVLTSCRMWARREQGTRAKQACRFDVLDDADTATASTNGSESSDHSWALGGSRSPTHSPRRCMAAARAEAMEPRWVRTDMAKEMPMSMGASLREGPTSVIVSELPPGYSEVLFVEEMRDGGFVRGRDYSEARLVRVSGASLCILKFVDVGVARAFSAAFEGRPMRHASGSFHVIDVPGRQ